MAEERDGIIFEHYVKTIPIQYGQYRRGSLMNLLIFTKNLSIKQIEDKIKEEQKIALETYKSIYDIDEDVKIKLTKESS